MKKKIAENFYTELEKISTCIHKYAAGRLVKDARKFLMAVTGKSYKDVKKMNASELYDEFYALRNKNIKYGKGYPPPWEQKQDLSKSPPDEIYEQLRTELGKRRAERSRLQSHSRSILEDAMAQKRMKTLYSGRHKPREGEEFIPSSGRKYRSLGTDKAPADFIYRGNPLPKAQGSYFNPKNYAYGTRHPGRAAIYAMSGEVTPTSRRLFKFKRPYGTKEGDYVAINDEGPFPTDFSDPTSKSGSPEHRRLQRYLSRNTSLNTGEVAAHIDDLKPNFVAEYKVRPSFHKGQVGFAAKRIK